MDKKITLDSLSFNSVSLKKQEYVVVDGVEYTKDLPHRKAYLNSEKGRIEVQSEVPEPYLSAIMSVWGDSPTIVESFDLGISD